MLALLGTYLLSLFVALLAALQLADHFRATEEYALVFAGIIVFSILSMGVLVVTSSVAKRARTLAMAAIALGILVTLTLATMASADWLSGRATAPLRIGRRDIPVLLGLALPAVLMILVQWGLVRRRWLGLRGEEEMSRWPWVTTMIGGLAVLNPLGLEVLSAAWHQAPGDMLRIFWAAIAAGGALAAVVMAALECYIRSRMLHRRAARSTQAAG